MTTLTEKEGVSQQELATRLYVTKGNISGLIDRLAEAGLVERRSTASDRRQHAIYLTEAGRTMAERAIAVQHRWIASTLGRMAEPDLEALEAKLLALRDIVREAETPGRRERRRVRAALRSLRVRFEGFQRVAGRFSKSAWRRTSRSSLAPAPQKERTDLA